jgi:threonyl-tRNA synthetase
MCAIETNPELAIKRHSVAHVMALAVQQLFGETVQFGVGPVLESGCFYDFVLPRPFVPEDLVAITKKYHELVKQNLIFKRIELPLDQAVARFTEKQQPLKVELLQDLEKFGTTKLDEQAREAFGSDSDKPVISIYTIEDAKTGGVLFEDLCRGPHIEHVKELRGMGVAADRFSAAYWRGDQERGISMQRLYSLIYESPELLNDAITLREEEAKRDHRKLGRELELFFFHETAPGLAYWLPKGLVLKNLLVEYFRQYHREQGYQEIATPLINKKELWETSGHWNYYKDDMFLTQTKDKETWALKPMNCPNAMVTFGFKSRSYRDLPLRLSDSDILHRDEVAGALHGLMRARCFCQDDSHNFVMESQIKEEFARILQIARDFYGAFGLLDQIKLYLSTRPDDFMGDIATWDKAEAELQEVLKASGFEYGIKEKDGAFYGPKIDIQFSDSLKREWQCGTIQLDFQLPRNFNLKYTAEDGSDQTPVVIHRAVYGSLERFIGIILEHTAGRLPYWVAPIQVQVLPVNDKVDAYLQQITAVLESTTLPAPIKRNQLRYEVDRRNESLGRKIREAELQKIPVMLIVGPKDEAASTVSVRTRDGEQSIALSQLGEYLAAYTD